MLHPGVGDENPQRRKVGAEGDEERHREMFARRQLVPAEEKQADESRFEKEGHQAFDRQRRAKDVADILRIIGPVRSELELHGQSSGDAEGEIDAEQLAPELRHVPVDFLARHDEDRLHDDEEPGQAERQRDEQEVEEGGAGELQPRQVDECRVDHGVNPFEWACSTAARATLTKRIYKIYEYVLSIYRSVWLLSRQNDADKASIHMETCVA